MADFVTDVTLTAENALQFTFNTPGRVVTMAAGTDIIVRDKLEFIQIHNDIFQTADVDADTILTVNGVAFTGTHADLLASIQAMAATSNGGAGTAPSADLESWIYKNSDYTLAGSSLDLKAVTLPVSISDNVDVIGKTVADNVHDGTNFKFAQGDIVDIRVNMFVELNVTSNMIIVQLLEGTNILSEGNCDTNKGLDAEHCIQFHDVLITPAMATNGLDVKITDIATGGTYLDVYEIFFSITKKGSNV